jgi:hypothetical protein
MCRILNGEAILEGQKEEWQYAMYCPLHTLERKRIQRR